MDHLTEDQFQNLMQWLDKHGYKPSDLMEDESGLFVMTEDESGFKKLYLEGLLNDYA